MRLIIAALLALSAHAQTRITLDQIKAPAGQVRLLILEADGKLSTVTLGDGLEIVGGQIKAKAIPAGFRLVKGEYALVRAEDGTYSASDESAIFRNGMLMSIGLDYTLVGGRVRPAEPWPSTDMITAVFYRVLPILPDITITRP
jgi:hypothetical protein